MNTIRSYPSIYNLGHKDIAELLFGSVVVQEKIDGSQISFMVKDGKLSCRSKDSTLSIEKPDKMFSGAVNTIKQLYEKGSLKEGITYRGEVVSKPKHNILKYDGIPKNYIVLFDVDSKQEDYVYDLLNSVGRDLDLEVAPTLFEGTINNLSQLEELLETESLLGGVKIEGIVIKNYGRRDPHGHVLMGKLVRDEFKARKKERKAHTPGSDAVVNVVEKFNREVWWQKAVQHLGDDGKLTQSTTDIGPLIKEIHLDLLREEGDSIKEYLFQFFWKNISKQMIAGFPEWYKHQLMQLQQTGNREGE